MMIIHSGRSPFTPSIVHLPSSAIGSARVCTPSLSLSGRMKGYMEKAYMRQELYWEFWREKIWRSNLKLHVGRNKLCEEAFKDMSKKMV